MGMYGAIASGLVKAVGSLHQTQAEMQSAEYQARVAEIQGTLARQVSESEAGDIRRKGRFLQGTQVARTRAAGLSLEGSPLQVMADSAAQVELDAQRALWGGQVQQTGFRDIQAMRKYEAWRAEYEMFNRAGAAFLGGFSEGGGSTLLSSAGSSMGGGGFGFGMGG